MTVNRREFLSRGMAGLFGLSLRSALLGVPASFLVNRSVNAAPTSPKFTIIAASTRGEPMNVNGPGTYPKNNRDIANRIAHPNPNEISPDLADTINGMRVDATDLATASDLNIGYQTVRAARAYRALDQAFLNHFTSFWHRTGTNAHPEFASVLEANGALRGKNGNGTEQLPSAIAQELAPALNTLLDIPMVLAGQYKSGGITLNSYRPSLISSLFSGDSVLPVANSQYNTLYTHTLNNLYRDLKQNGTPKQKQFLDQHLISRRQAEELGENLSQLLQEVDDTQAGQVRTAIALIKLKIAPVIVMKHDYGNDNHTDRRLSTETTHTFEALKSFALYWDLIQEHQLTDKVLFVTLDVFGRTVTRNKQGGRDHWGRFTHAFLHGTHLRGGILGGMEPRGSRAVQASGINSSDGSGTNPDISGDETLAALHATIMAAAGVPEERIQARIPDGKVVRAAFS